MRNKVQLGNIATIYSGGTPSRSEPSYWGGKIPWVKTTQIQNKVINNADVDEWITEEGLKNSSTKMVSKGSILMAMYGQGKTRGQIAILGLNATINQACAAIQLKKDADRDYVFQQLLFRYNAIRRLSNSGSQKNLSAGLIKEIIFPLPDLKSQKFIADILAIWDSAIKKTERLIEAKEKKYKWLLNELIYKGTKQNGWNNVKLGKLFNEVTEKVGERDIPPFSISAGIGFVSQKEKWGKDIAGKQYQNYVCLRKGQFAYNKGNSKKYTCGCIYLLNDHTEIAVPNVFISFKSKAKSICPEFYEHYFIADHHARELRKYISSSARSDGLLNLNKKDFFKILVPYPPADKQKAIADALTTARQEIVLLERLGGKYKEQKRGLMQKLLTGQWRVMVEKEKSQ